MGILENLEKIEDRLMTVEKLYTTGSHTDQIALQYYLYELETIIHELQSATSKFLNKEVIASLTEKANNLVAKIEDDVNSIHSID